MKAQVSSGKQPFLFVISGPSGVGKDAVLAQMKEWGRPIHFTVTATTRKRRDTERNRVDYHFVSVKKFKEMIERGEMLEWAEVYGNFYGVPRGEVKQALERGEDVMIKVDVQGAATIKRVVPGAVLIFLVAPSLAVLEERLRNRRSDSNADIERRIRTASAEMKRVKIFDYVVVNTEVSQAMADVESIITAEKCRAKPRKVKL